MTDYIHDSALVADSASFQRAPNASITVYDADDATNAVPLVLKDLNGLPLANPLTSSQDAFTPAFVTSSAQVKLVGGGLTVVLNSFQGLREDALAAQESAHAAAASAAEAAAAAQAPTAEQIDAGIARADIPGKVAEVVPGLVSAQVPPLVGPLVSEALAADDTVAEAAAAAAAPAVAHELDSSPRIPKAGQAGSFRIRDNNGRQAFGVDSAGDVRIGATTHKETPGWRVRDITGKMAVEVDENGKTHIYDPAFSIEQPVTNVHILAGIGQSNMSGFALPAGGRYDPADPRILQYGALNGPTLGITTATVPLNFNGAPDGLSPLTVIARETIKELSPGHVILLVPAAKGSSGLVYQGSAGKWAIDYDGVAVPALYPMFIAQLDAAKAAAAAKWPSAAISHDATFWVQGEGDATTARSAYEAALDALVADLRSHVGDANHPFIVGGMVPDYMVGKPGNLAIRAAHVDTPRRLIRCAYVDGIPNAANYNETIHYAREGAIRLGKAMYEAVNRAVASTASAHPTSPLDVTASAIGGTLTVNWKAPICRVTAYLAEYSIDGGGWVAMAQPEPLELTATATGLTGTAVSVRVTTKRDAEVSTPSLPITIGL